MPLTIRVDLWLECMKQLAQAGIPTEHYSGHSFRIGAAMTAAQAGLQDSTFNHRADTLVRPSCAISEGPVTPWRNIRVHFPVTEISADCVLCCHSSYYDRCRCSYQEVYC